MRATIALLAIACTVPATKARAQEAVPRIHEQDSTRNNLVTPQRIRTVPLGTLGAVVRRGTGPQTMLLIPGLGFGASVFDPLMRALADSFTMVAVTLPGFDGTAPPPTPPAGTSYGAQTWTLGAQRAIEDLVSREDLRDIVVVGHWLTGTQLALRLRAALPDRVRAVVLLAGSARFAGPRAMTAEQRVEFVDGPFSQGWFRTVTRETWDDNNFLPSDYAADPVLGLRLWRQAARPDLHVWIRYLLEYHASDIRTEHGATRTPVLLLHPGLEGAWREPTGDYLTAFTRAGWGDLAGTGIEARTIPGARLVPWVDQLAPVVTEIRRFSGASPGVADRRPGQ
ncbi:MAG: alpha/beta fold hydrolase [Gemmatimonadetes bacterium]|nr:alpha/beta fold hydrolase [Gemmatimonadota bacterium]MBP6669667.1 alpha/beta fold hydrolase [Gemmatimonadales bacterium]MBK7923360.1 alpha/beta fold hydrolase [Gemmatimonadota bacterium]MBK9066820.1 alpha/beta fold hydrolase [Gemmatimonadota bacterium]MBK9692598.1 alpha/beta fold hydrolase [Gemmatimonadota bacterium]